MLTVMMRLARLSHQSESRRPPRSQGRGSLTQSLSRGQGQCRGWRPAQQVRDVDVYYTTAFFYSYVMLMAICICISYTIRGLTSLDWLCGAGLPPLLREPGVLSLLEMAVDVGGLAGVRDYYDRHVTHRTDVYYKASWYTPHMHFDTEHQYLPGVPCGPVGNWVAGSSVAVAMKYALELLPSKQVWLLSPCLFAVIPLRDKGSYQDLAAHQLISDHADVEWMATASNTVAAGEGDGCHWLLLLYNRPRHALYVIDSFGVVAEVPRKLLLLLSGLRPGTQLQVEGVALDVQQDGRSCGCHVVAAFMVWLSGGGVGEMRQKLTDEVSQEAYKGLMRWAVNKGWLGLSGEGNSEARARAEVLDMRRKIADKRPPKVNVPHVMSLSLVAWC